MFHLWWMTSLVDNRHWVWCSSSKDQINQMTDAPERLKYQLTAWKKAGSDEICVFRTSLLKIFIVELVRKNEKSDCFFCACMYFCDFLRLEWEPKVFITSLIFVNCQRMISYYLPVGNLQILFYGTFLFDQSHVWT